MKTKKLFHWILMAAVVMGLGATVTACSDDDDDKKEQRNADADPNDTEENQVAWRWLCAMTDIKSQEGNWNKKTYEPTIGVPSENNKLHRLVIVKDLDEAKKNFASIADMEVSQLSTSQTFNVSGVGKLTWTPSAANAQNLAEVTVDTKLIPTLQKIIYCTEEQRGENGLFSKNITGAAYYRFGDVIYKDGYYWVCVRPCHEVGDKGKSHWINVVNYEAGNGLPEGNIYSKYDQKYNNKTIKLPTGLKYNREHIYNFANLIWALLEPGEYSRKVGATGKGLGDIPYEYHNEFFVTSVAEDWKKTKDRSKSIWELVFNKSYDEMKKYNELNFYYQGYKWIFGDNCTLWRYTQGRYQYSIEGSESGDKISWPVKEKGFDVNNYVFHKDADKNAGHKQTETENGVQKGYWVVRYATGEDLTGSDGKLTPTSGIPLSTEIYRYYKGKVEAGTSWEKAKDYDKMPDNYDREPQVGYVFTLDRHIYKNTSESYRSHSEPMAYICCIGTPWHVDESEQTTVMAIAKIPVEDEMENTFKWGAKDKLVGEAFGTGKYDAMTQVCNGLGMTKKLMDLNSHLYEAADQCENYFEYTIGVNTKWADTGLGYSKWFLPSTGQWALFFKALGVWDNRTNGDKVVEAINAFYDNLGDDYKSHRVPTDGTLIWTSTEVDKDKAWAVGISKRDGIFFKEVDKTDKHVVFPFLIITPKYSSI